METETIQQNVIADEHLPTEGEQSPSKSVLLHIFCNECGAEIENCKSLRKKFCNDCLKKHGVLSSTRWKQQNPEKSKIIRNRNNANWRKRNPTLAYQRNKKHVDKWRQKNHDTLIRLNRESYWRCMERLGIIVERRFLITNCIICDQDISMYPSQCKLCMNCREKHLGELGTTNCSQHMRRKYDHVLNKVVPDYDAERRFIDAHLKEYGLR